MGATWVPRGCHVPNYTISEFACRFESISGHTIVDLASRSRSKGLIQGRVEFATLAVSRFGFKYMLPDGQDLTVFDWSLQLAQAPCGPIGMESPNRLSRHLLENPHGFSVIDGGQA